MNISLMRPLFLSALALAISLPTLHSSDAQARPGDYGHGGDYRGGNDHRGGRGDDRGRGNDRGRGTPVYVPPRRGPVYVPPPRHTPPVVIYRNPYRRRAPVDFIMRGQRRYYHPPVRLVFPPPVVFYRPIPNVVFVDVLADWRLTRRIDFLGSTALEVNEQDYDVIPVEQCGITKLNFYVKHNDAVIKQVIVNYRDGGEPTEVDVNAHFYASAYAQEWIDLPGYERCVSDVIVIGNTVGDIGEGNRQAVIEVYGERPQ